MIIQYFFMILKCKNVMEHFVTVFIDLLEKLNFEFQNFSRETVLQKLYHLHYRSLNDGQIERKKCLI